MWGKRAGKGKKGCCWSIVGVTVFWETSYSLPFVVRFIIMLCLSRKYIMTRVSGGYSALFDDGRRCRRCGRRSQLFGDFDIRTGWAGWCMMCNEEWYDKIRVVRCCNRGCFLEPVLLFIF